MAEGASDILALQQGMRDLVALTTLPAIWTGNQPRDIVVSLSEVMLTTSRLDFVFIVLQGEVESQKLSLVRTAQLLLIGEEAQTIGKTFTHLLTPKNANTVLTMNDPFSEQQLIVAIIPIGHEGREGFALAGVQATSKFTEIDRLLLRVAANQGFVALQQAQLLADLRLAVVQEQAARDEAQHTAHQITLLQEFTSKLSQLLTAEEIARVTLETGRKLFGNEHGIVYLVVQEGKALRILCQLPANEDFPDISDFSLSVSSPCTDTIRTKQMICFMHRDTIREQYSSLVIPLWRENLHALIAMPLAIENQVLGCLELDFTTPREITEEEVKLLLAVAQQCAQALERARLSEQAKVSAALEERQRLARDLHDAVSQVLFSASLIGETLVRTWERDPQRAIDQLNQVVILIRAALSEMRTLLLELRPEAIIRSRLSQLLTYLTEAARGRGIADAQLIIEGNEEALPPDVLIAFYRIAQESINNVVKHSAATQLRLSLYYETDWINLEISDNGRGFDPHQSSPGFGTSSMRERAEAVNATFQISSALGKGSHVLVTWTRTPSTNY